MEEIEKELAMINNKYPFAIPKKAMFACLLIVIPPNW